LGHVPIDPLGATDALRLVNVPRDPQLDRHGDDRRRTLLGVAESASSTERLGQGCRVDHAAAPCEHETEQTKSETEEEPAVRGAALSRARTSDQKRRTAQQHDRRAEHEILSAHDGTALSVWRISARVAPPWNGGNVAPSRYRSAAPASATPRP